MTYKTTGTLKEIGAKVGDVVQVIGGKSWQIVRIDDDGQYLINDPPSRQLSKTLPFRIISRAKPEGPVRTVTRKDIVPGVYGDVEISEYGEVRVMWMDGISQIDAAIATLTEIRDAL